MTVTWTDPHTNEQLTVSATELFFADLLLQPNQYARCHITATGGTLDSLQIAVYHRVVSAGSWSTVPSPVFVLDASSPPASIEFNVEGPWEHRIGVVRVGSTDTFTVDLDMRIATKS